MMTKYGLIRDDDIVTYFSKLVGRVFKIIPMQEEKCTTLEEYTKSLIREIIGISELFSSDELLVVVGVLNGLDYSNHKILRSDIFKAIDMIHKIKDSIK